MFVAAKILGSPGKNNSLLIHSDMFQGNNDHHKVLSVIITITVRLCLAAHK